MRIRMPLTGTVKAIDPCIIGEKDDPIRPLDVMGNVAWRMISLDLDAEEMEIEVTPADEVGYDTGEKDEQGKSIWVNRLATPEERAALIENARDHSLERMSAQALYALSKSKRLVNPFKRARAD